MGNGEAGAVGQLLHGLNGQVGANGPVSAQDHSHDDQHQGIVLQQSGHGEHDEPVSGGSLLHLHMAGGEQGAALGVLVEADQQDVDDESDQQQDHDGVKSLAEDFHNAVGDGILAEVGVDNGGVQVEAVLQAYQDGPEVRDQSAGAHVQDQHTDDGLQGAAQGGVPLFAFQQVAEQDDEADHVGSVLQNVVREEFPDRG